MSSRWADTEADQAEALRRKKEKEEKKRQKQQKQAQQAALLAASTQKEEREEEEEEDAPPSKKRRLSSSNNPGDEPPKHKPEDRKLLRFQAGTWSPCRHTSNYEILNPIEEGSYGYVSRARDISTSQIVALKKVKMENEDGFPTTALREITILQRARHANIVTLHEVVAGPAPANDTVLVMEFLEHDLKTLQDDMPEPFLASEIKTLLRQLTSALSFLHANSILHRDLKTSNILLSNRGHVKIADFGMARYTPPPDAPLTTLVVTLWYRAPELLLGTHTYGPEIDIWSLGCIMGELILKDALLQGKNEVDQLDKILHLCGLPTEKTYPEFWRLPNSKSLRIPRSSDQKASSSLIRSKFPFLTTSGVDLLSALLSLNPLLRPTAEDVLNHAYFTEAPKPKPMELFPTFPSKAGREKRRRKASPDAPRRGRERGGEEVDFSGVGVGIFGEEREDEVSGAGFQLRVA